MAGWSFEFTISSFPPWERLRICQCHFQSFAFCECVWSLFWLLWLMRCLKAWLVEHLEFSLSSEDLCETWWWIATGIINWLLPHLDLRVFRLASFVHNVSEILSLQAQNVFWVTVDKRWHLFNTCHQLVAASPWHPCYMCFVWRLYLKNYPCKGLLLSTVAQKYWVLKLTIFLSHSRQEVAFVYDGGVCVFQLAHGRLAEKREWLWWILRFWFFSERLSVELDCFECVPTDSITSPYCVFERLQY